jgi:hypothetical protein
MLDGKTEQSNVIGLYYSQAWRRRAERARMGSGSEACPSPLHPAPCSINPTGNKVEEVGGKKKQARSTARK